MGNDSNSWLLMWSLIDGWHSLGAMHGISGTLSVLISPELEELYPKIVHEYPKIAATITGLCEVCIKNGGHLPMLVPSLPTEGPLPMVQVCHGAPGLICLLVCAKEKFKTHARILLLDMVRSY